MERRFRTLLPLLLLYYIQYHSANAQTFRIPESSRVLLTSTDLSFSHYQLSFAIQTEGFGVLFQQPELLTSGKDFFRISLTQTGQLSLGWKYKGVSYQLTHNAFNYSLNDNLWHVVHLTLEEGSLICSIDDEESVVTTLSEHPTLFVLRVSAQDGRLVVGHNLSDSFCIQLGVPFASDQLWFSSGQVMTADSFQQICSGWFSLSF